MEVWLQFTIIVILILANGFFAGSEIALVSSRRGRLQHAAEAGSRNARIALQLLGEPSRFLATIQVGITLIGTFAAAFGGDVFADPLAQAIAPYVGAQYARIVAFVLIVLMITYLSLILGELVPKRLALQSAETIATFAAPIMQIISRLAAPVVWFLTLSTQLVLRLLGRHNQQEEQVTEEDILSLVHEGTIDGTIEASERELIERVFDFTNVTARSIMTPRTEIFAVAIDTPLDQVVSQVLEAGYSRVPVYRGSLDTVEGILHAKDLLRVIYNPDNGTLKLADLLRPPVFVPEHQPISTVLQLFRQSQTHLALVVDEYGQIDGIVTLEDVLEELTGDIADEYDEANTMVVRRPDGSFLVDGLLPYADAEDQLGLPLRSDLADLPNFDTLAGLLLALLEHIPTTGERITWRDWHFEIVDMDGARIDKVLVRRINPVGKQEHTEASSAMSAGLPAPQQNQDGQR